MWKQEFIRLMYPINRDEIRMEEAMELKFINIPESLYKYRAFSQYSLENFLNDEVWITSANTFNDPYDCAHTLDFNAIVDEKIKQALLDNIPIIINKHKLDCNPDEVIDSLKSKSYFEILKFSLNLDENFGNNQEKLDQFIIAVKETIEEEHKKRLIEMIERFQRSTYVCCFSEVNDSTLMWSHYAKDHSGFCLEYNFKQCGPNDILTRALEPVIYTNYLFDMTPYIKESGRFNNLVSTFSAISKSKDWEYEKEWRLTFPIGEDFKPFNRMVPTPVAIYLGARIDSNNKGQLMEIAKKKNMKIYQMNLNTNGFSLIKEEIF